MAKEAKKVHPQRLDEQGQPCPSTLGGYRALCAAIGGPNCKAVKFLDERIARDGEDEPVIQADSQMRMLLMPMLVS
jgi:hypothetical protein